MRKKAQLLALLISLCLIHLPTASAAWVWSPEAGKFVNPDAEVQDTPQEQYDYAMEFYKQKKLKEAIGQLRLLLKKFPGSQIAPEAQYRLGVLCEEQGDYFRAFRAYRDLLQKYPQSERMNEAVEREFRIGNLFLSGRRAKLMGLAILPSGPRAIEVFRHIVDAAPYSKYGDKAQFHLALAYKKLNRFEEAIEAFQGVVDQYPSSDLVAQARFQMADTSYLQTVAATRDQRVMDRAGKEIDRFLKEYPDSSVSDKAAKLRQEIDEKNAEKNYRIGLFYEKENFLDSAFIYYRDVSERYAHTQWGTQAKERLLALEKPAEFLRSQEQEIALRKQELARELQAAGADTAQRKELEWQLKRVEKEEKGIRKSKPETLKRRRTGLKQKEIELREKEKALTRKRKRYSKNLSEDLSRTFDQWQASIEKEKMELAKERMRIQDWEKSLGVDTTPFYEDLVTELVPFGRPAPNPVEQVRELEARKIEELDGKKKKLREEKENFYREYEKLLAAEGALRPGDAAYSREREKLDQGERDIKNLESEVERKGKLFEKHFGTAAWRSVWKVPTNVVGRSVGLLNPFDEALPKKDWSSQSPDQLKKSADQWREKVTIQKRLVDSIAQTFDHELSRAEQERLSLQVQDKETDPAALRRAVKQMEREIRARYNEIQDRNDRKNELLEELDRMMHGKEEEGTGTRSANALTAPIRGSVWFWRSFLFGLPERDVELTEEAKRMTGEGADSAGIRAVQEEIELESILIDARNREIEGLTRELEALRARASLSGVPPFRSLLVKFPYVFVREAIVSANRLVPKKDRKERLINQLNQETEKLEALKRDLGEIENLLEGKSARAASPEPAAAPTIKPPAPETAPDRAALQAKIQSLRKELELKRETFEFERKRFEAVRWDKLSEGRTRARSEKLRDIEEKLTRLIEAEQEMDQEEQALLARKKEMVDAFLEDLSADVFGQELHLEQKEIQSRLNELQKKQSSLGEELRRFRPQAFPPSG